MLLWFWCKSTETLFYFDSWSDMLMTWTQCLIDCLPSHTLISESQSSSKPVQSRDRFKQKPLTLIDHSYRSSIFISDHRPTVAARWFCGELCLSSTVIIRRQWCPCLLPCSDCNLTITLAFVYTILETQGGAPLREAIRTGYAEKSIPGTT